MIMAWKERSSKEQILIVRHQIYKNWIIRTLLYKMKHVKFKLTGRERDLCIRYLKLGVKLPQGRRNPAVLASQIGTI
jgi:hypothetical protein